MTLVQLEYIVALDTHRHFSTAAAACFVTQPTLSMQIQKLEEELGVKIFDRSKQPVLPTEYGMDIIQQARKILADRDVLLEMVDAKKGIIHGELKIGIIPTLAPYLLPLFIHAFTKKFAAVKLQVSEYTTDQIIQKLKEGNIDVGILVTPLHEKGIKEEPLFYEEMLAYVSKNNEVFKKTYVLPKDIDPGKLWLLEEGHCFRSQILNLCELRKPAAEGGHFEYEAGSLETLRRMVDLYDGVTILPELATLDMSSKQQACLRYFKSPAPVREVSMVTHRNYVKRRLVEVLKQQIEMAIPDKIKQNKKTKVVPI
ncbi:MAG: hydrogen peroxide-inducible genes activator [Hydrotalea flava]|uniref:hydrogen peroxide-inducible genes activator n=1 Tax=Hydrotalea TaxID=1004300 RepID=UPI000944F8EA|nr:MULTISPECIES: hydrogen peroxide-inducible genes activator [Hydrotalea]MBY0348368.1 hydrogen peroxide-inducible genes activator [Hydrotalea flava]RWZ86335.1 MAG: hydrogen peroxide-inducible genes activator [Hydrotalea sp. AMD]